MRPSPSIFRADFVFLLLPRYREHWPAIQPADIARPSQPHKTFTDCIARKLPTEGRPG